VFSVLDIFSNNLFEKIGSSLNVHGSNLLRDELQGARNTFVRFRFSEQGNHAE
jgi:hypothetical protein